MGIKGLWSEVKPICRQSHLSNFRGQRVAVDMYVWLHRGIIGSVQLGSTADAEMFITSVDTEPDASASSVRLTTKFLQFVMGRVELMLRCGIHPVLVFDGAPIPMKKGTEEERHLLRAARLTEAVQILKKGSAANPRARQEAAQLLEKGMDITTELAHAVIQVLQEKRLECIVAPYEADAQLAYLCKEGYVQAVISEDSDLIAYHCPCLIAKLDGQGNCEVVVAQDLPRCPSFHGLSYQSFLLGCILSGCDYLPNLRNVGIKKAFRLVAQATSVSSIMQTLQVKFGFAKEELDEYEAKLQQAFYCFAHHFVFDPIRKEVIHLTALPRGIPLKTHLLGESLTKDIAEKVCAECLYDPVTKALYRCSYVYCVEEYLKQVRGGQKSLKTYKGFQYMQSPKVTIVLNSNDTEAAGRRVSPTTTFFSSPLQKVCEAKGFCEKIAPRSSNSSNNNNNMPIVQSKYFAPGRWKVEDWESDDDDNTDCSPSNSTPTATTQSTTIATTFDSNVTAEAAETGEEESHASAFCLSSLRFVAKDTNGHNVDSPSVSLSQSHPTQDDECLTQPLKQEEKHMLIDSGAVPEASGAVLPSPVPSPIPTQKGITILGVPESQQQHKQHNEEKRGCPFGYIQCGRQHSIFELCFQGKNWSKEVTTVIDEDGNHVKKPRHEDSVNSHNCTGELPPHSCLQKSTGINSAPPMAKPLGYKPAFRKPASTAEAPTAIDMSPHAVNLPPAAIRRQLSSTDQAMQLMRRLNPASATASTVTAPKAEDNTSHGKGAAADLFEKLSFARR